MKRSQLEHIVRAAAGVAADRGVLVIGSQSILGTFPDAALPREAVQSMEADVVALTRDRPLEVDGDKTDLVDGAIGEGSMFHQTHGVYAQGVGIETATLPLGWEDRLVLLRNTNTEPGHALCLEPHDCVLAKMVAGRDKDYAFGTALLMAGLVRPRVLEARIDHLPVEESVKHRIREWLRCNRPRRPGKATPKGN